MSPFKNPYHPIIDDGEAFFTQTRVFEDLDARLLHVDEAAPISIISERGIGGKEAIRLYLKSRGEQLPFQVLECDIKNDLKSGEGAATFYLDLVQFIWNNHAIPADAARLASELVQNHSTNWLAIERDIKQFFRYLKADTPKAPLLVVFYSFDRLPKQYKLAGDDFNLLRQLYYNLDLRIYYLIHSHRPIDYIERQNGIVSKFNALFPSPIRLGLLSESDAKILIRKPAFDRLKREPWDAWLANQILILSGRNQGCLETSCFYLFDQIWNRGRIFSQMHITLLADELYQQQIKYFRRLYDHLLEDDLVETLVDVIQSGYKSDRAGKITELLLLGYFTEENIDNGDNADIKGKRYVIFSPLFLRYLEEREQIHSVPLLANPSSSNIPDGHELLEDLTGVEIEVLRLMAEHLSKPVIAMRLHKSPDTIKKQVDSICRKMQIEGKQRMAEAVERAHQLRLI